MEQKKKKTNDILKQGTILAAASILVRMIGLLYRIPVNNLLGETGNGIYSTAYQVYSTALIVSSYGLPLAVSKMVAAKNVKKEYRNAQKIFHHALIFTVLVGGLVASIVFFGAEFFADVMKLSAIVMPLRVLAPTIFICAVLGVFRGFFQGQNTMVPTAVSQVFEQILNAIVSVLAAYQLMRIFSDSANKYAYGAAGSSMGTLVGALTGLAVMVFVYMLNRKTFHKRIEKDQGSEDSVKDIYKVLLMTVIPVILSQTVYNINSIIDNGMFSNIMSGKGIAEKLRSDLIGVYSGQYVLLLSVPLGIATAMGTSIIPSVVASFSKGAMDEVKYKVKTVVKFNMMLAFPCAVGLAVLGGPICQMLFPRLSSYRELAANMLLFGSIALIFYALSTVTSGVLQAIDRMRLPVIHSSVSLGIHVVLVYVLLKFTNLGIYSLIIGYITFPLVVCILNWRAVSKALGYAQEVKTTFVLPGVASLVMGAACLGVYKVLSCLLSGVGSYIGNAVATMIAIIIGVVIYFVAALLLKTVSEEELSEMPMGRTMCSVAKKIHLM